METLEEWRQVEGWPYQVSSLGRVRRTPGSAFDYGRECRKARLSKKGYLMVVLSHHGKTATVYVHHLVCVAFNGAKPSSQHQVAHYDGNKTNNLPTNLRWATASENSDDNVRTGARLYGDKATWAKLTELEALQILHSKERTGVLAKRFHVSPTTVCAIRNRSNWKHLAA